MTGNLFDEMPATVEAERKPKQKERPVEPPKPDPVADILVEKGFVPNDFILDLNKGLTVPSSMEMTYPWSLPSRLFMFPIEVTDQLADGSRRIGLLHPLLADHPFVKQVEAALGIELDPNGAPNEYGHSKTETGKWWHAVDLVSRGMWRELLDTIRFTTIEHVAGAVSYGLEYSPYEGKKRNGHLSPTEAREIMASIDSIEPADREETVRQSIARPASCSTEKGADRWPINGGAFHDPYDHAWGLILGIEAGWFAHDRAGFLGWTEQGRALFPPTLGDRMPEQRRHDPSTPLDQPNVAVEIADQFGPRPAGNDKQLGLFTFEQS